MGLLYVSIKLITVARENNKLITADLENKVLMML